MEALRYTSITPLSLPHYSRCDSDINGFFVPKHTIIFPNLWHLHHDEKFWDSPWDFDPSRFLTGDGKVIPPDHVKRQRLLPFSAGKRQCPGEEIVRNMLFNLITLMIQKYKLLPAEGHPRPRHDPREYTGGLTVITKPYYLSIQIRK